MGNIREKNIIGMASAVLMFVSAFLSYEVLMVDGKVISSRTLMNEKDGYLVLGIAVLAFILTTLEKYLGTTLTGVAGAGLLIFKMILNAKSNEQMKSAFAYMQEHMSMEAAYHYNIGFYLLMLSSILLIVSGFLYLRKKA